MDTMREKSYFIQDYEKYLEWKEKSKKIKDEQKSLYAFGKRFIFSTSFGFPYMKIVDKNYEYQYNGYTSCTFKLDDEDLEYLYNKYKPLVEEWKCEEHERKIRNVQADIKRNTELMNKLVTERCKENTDKPL